MITVIELADRLGATLEASGATDSSVSAEKTVLSKLATLDTADTASVSFLSSAKMASRADKCAAAALVVSQSLVESIAGFKGWRLIVQDAYQSFAELSSVFATRPQPSGEIHPSASIHPSAQIGSGVSIGAHSVIAANAIIEDDVSIGPLCFVGNDVCIGSHTHLDSRVTIYQECRVGRSCLLQSGAVIGSDGFGYAPVPYQNEEGSRALRWKKIHQIGRVIIGDQVEIGANTCIDRGAIDDTTIGDYCILDNQIHIAHNVQIGNGTAIAANCGIAGSTRIGHSCLLGGSVQISGHLTIGDGVELKGGSIVLTDIENGKTCGSATPLLEEKIWRRYFVRLKELNQLFARVKRLEK